MKASDPVSWKPGKAEKRKMLAAVDAIDRKAIPAISRAIKAIQRLPRGDSLCLHLMFAKAQLGVVRNFLIGPSNDRRPS